MKATINTMDLRIAKAMKEAANVVFDAMPKTQDVNITSMQVYQHFTDAKRNVKGMPKDQEFTKNIPVVSGEGWEIGADAEITINIDSYSCKLYGIAIFYYLNTFERIAGVKDRARFTYSMPKTETAKVMTITVDKNAVDILAHADNSGIRPVLQGVYVDFKYHNIIATDGHTMQVMRCEIVGNVPNIAGVVIPSNIAKRVLKERVFTFSVDGTMCVCGNECFTFESYLPAYYRVFPSFINESDQFIKLAPKAWNVVRKQAQSAKKNDNRHFVFRALSGEHKITVDVYSDLIWNKEGKFEGVLTNTFTFDIETAAPVSFTKAFSVEYLLRFKTVESIQGLDDSRAMCMYNGNSISLAMPYKVYNVNDNYILFTDDSKNKHFAPVDAYKIDRETANTIPVETMEETANTVPVETMEETANTIPVETMEETANTIPVETMEETANTIPVETMEETANTIPVETMEEDRPEKAFMAFIWAMVAACIMAVLVLTGTRPHIALQAANTIPVETMEETANTLPVETMEEAADVVTIEAAINDVICTGSFDTYYNKVKEEIITNYRDIMKSQLQEIADNNNEVFAAMEAADVEPVAEEIALYSEPEELEEIADTLTEEDSDTADTITEDQSDTADTLTDGSTYDYSCNGYTVIVVESYDSNGELITASYVVPLNE